MPKTNDPDNTNKAHQFKVEQNVTDHEHTIEPEEIGGPKGPEPTRYGDWERRGRCIDF